MDKQQKLIEKVKPYIENGKLNLSYFRSIKPSLYNQICAIFENIDDFKKCVEPVECYYDKKYIKRSPDEETKVTLAEKSFRNILAYEKLNMLRQEMTYEQIATIYGITKQNVQHLYKKLSDLYVDEENNNVYNQNTNQKGEV